MTGKPGKALLQAEKRTILISAGNGLAAGIYKGRIEWAKSYQLVKYQESKKYK